MKLTRHESRPVLFEAIVHRAQPPSTRQNKHEKSTFRTLSIHFNVVLYKMQHTNSCIILTYYFLKNVSFPTFSREQLVLGKTHCCGTNHTRKWENLKGRYTQNVWNLTDQMWHVHATFRTHCGAHQRPRVQSICITCNNSQRCMLHELSYTTCVVHDTGCSTENKVRV